MTLSSEQFHTLYDGAAQPVILVRDGAVAELNCHAQELFAVGTALRAYLPQDAALPEMLYARPAVLPVMAGGVCVSANTQPLDDALLLPPQDTRDELAAFCRAAQSISTPLTTLLSVSGTLFPLLSEAEDPAVQQNLAVLNRACYQLLRASENLSYVQHGRLPLSLEKTDLTDFLDGLAQRADELCRQMGLALEVDLPQAPIFVWIDRRQVRRALLALGRADVGELESLTPLDSGVTVVGGSSDHCILDVTDCSRSLQVGDTVSFALRYSHLLYLSGREDVRQAFIR